MSSLLACAVKATVLGISGVWVATLVPDVPGSDFVGVPIGLAIGWAMLPAIRSHRDTKVPLLAAAVAGACFIFGQAFLAARAHSPAFVLYIGIEAVFAAVGVTIARVHAFAAGDAQAIAQHDMKNLQRWTEELEARPKPRAVGSAKVRCAVCDEMVDASSTRLDEARGIVCASCN